MRRRSTWTRSGSPRATAGGLTFGALALVFACSPALPSTSAPGASTASPSSATIGDQPLGSLGIGGRLDADAAFIDGAGSFAYAFDVADGDGQLRVSLDLSNRDDCVVMQLHDPAGRPVSAAGPDRPVVCPPEGGGQVFDIEQGVPAAATGPWRVTIDLSDARSLSFRLRVTSSPAPTPASDGQLLPDLVPWLPWEFGFVTPISGSPGTAHDRDNGPGDPALSCHPIEEPDDERCLRFSAGVYNAGDGPMSITFRDDIAYQHVYSADETPLTYEDDEERGAYTETEAGTGEWHPSHEHRHLSEFVLYELFEVTDAAGTLAPIGTGGKHGYCTFSQQIMDWDSIQQDPQYASFPSGAFCDDAMTLERGWGDLYRWQRPGQYVAYDPVEESDGSMRAGSYLVRFTVDPVDHIVEKDETNNIGYARIDVVDHGAADQDEVIVCEQGMGQDPWDPAHEVVRDRFLWARLAADPGYVAPSCS